MVINIKDFQKATDIANSFGGGCSDFNIFSEDMTPEDFWTNCVNPSWITWIASCVSNTDVEKQLVITTILDLLNNDGYIKTENRLQEYLNSSRLSLVDVNNIEDFNIKYEDINNVLLSNLKTQVMSDYVLDAYLSVKYVMTAIQFYFENKPWHINLANCVALLCLSESKRTGIALETVMSEKVSELKTSFNFVYEAI